MHKNLLAPECWKVQYQRVSLGQRSSCCTIPTTEETLTYPFVVVTILHLWQSLSFVTF